MQKACIRQFALNVEKNANSHSSLTEVDPFTAESAILNEDHREDNEIIGKESG
jgi:hypothetical protein